ncbi:hypothetical protein DL93DRAFT_2026499, partial [Clavulina sp. PMI_390]
FADNTGALQRIYKGTRGLDQGCSTTFRETIHQILNDHPSMKITIEWVSGHQNILGNEIADFLAKRACSEDPQDARPPAAFVRNAIKKSTRERWTRRWAEQATNNTRRSDFRAANLLPPRIQPSKRITNLTPKSFARPIQCQMGH